MDLNNIIKPCFGCDDHILASHSINEKRLRTLIKDGRSNGKSYDDFEKEVVYYLWKKDIHESIRIDHINQQIQRLKSYWK